MATEQQRKRKMADRVRAAVRDFDEVLLEAHQMGLQVELDRGYLRFENGYAPLRARVTETYEL